MSLHETLCPVADAVLKVAPRVRPARPARVRPVEESRPRIHATCPCGQPQRDGDAGRCPACARPWFKP